MTYMNHNLVSFVVVLVVLFLLVFLLFLAAKIHIAKNLDKINMAKLIF